MSTTKKHLGKILLLVLLLVIITASGGWWLYQTFKEKPFYGEITEAEVANSVEQILYYRIEGGNPNKASINTYNIFNDLYFRNINLYG